MDSSSSEEDNENPRETPQEPTPEDFATSSSSLQNFQSCTPKRIIRMAFRGGWKYLTEWVGFPVASATWEPISTFLNCSRSSPRSGSVVEIHPVFKKIAENTHPTC
ncbi:hypothetical protein M569_17576 [Genlisea aurea]|uniref:Chromo domain-containing protein n=1 Tax=Genlisea aurea TaxID=192259 RepID=S8D3G5_9LAMI|nr:hypothetical protein M569_17576 [Genlisea aurea]